MEDTIGYISDKCIFLLLRYFTSKDLKIIRKISILKIRAVFDIKIARLWENLAFQSSQNFSR